MWETVVEGRQLHFQLFGINNQNFIMRDRETGTWWQQVSGKGIEGPLKGKQLTLVDHDELSFELWKRENPDGRVLRPDPSIAASNKYAPEDWEARIGRLPVVTPIEKEEPLPPREIILGIETNGEAKAYPLSALRKQSPIVDSIGGVPIMILLAEDGESIRAFETTLSGQKLQFYAKAGSPSTLVDTATASDWNFAGEAIRGSSMGKTLKKVPVLKDYWFDWKAYHPRSTVYSRTKEL